MTVLLMIGTRKGLWLAHSDDEPAYAALGREAFDQIV